MAPVRSSKRAAHNLIFGSNSKRGYSHILENTRIKTPRDLERLMKGVSNHRRIQILMLLAKSKTLTMDQIAQALDCNFKTISGHTQKMVQSGLIQKKYLGQSVLHTITPQGKRLYSFLSSF
jgi:predicted transcriptional regulator